MARRRKTDDERDPARLLDALRALQREDREGLLDPNEVQRVTEALLERYRASTDAAAFANPLQGPEMIARFAAQFQGVTLATLNGRDLDELLFEIIPEKVTAGPEIARDIVDSARALFVWLGREHALEQADELVELLGDDAVRELEHHLEDPSTYGPAKTLAMEALAAGVDFSDPDAIDAFMRSRIGMRVGAGLAGPFADPYAHGLDGPAPAAGPPLTPEQRRERQKKRKKDRKASRKARKKSR